MMARVRGCRFFLLSTLLALAALAPAVAFFAAPPATACAASALSRSPSSSALNSFKSRSVRTHGDGLGRATVGGGGGERRSSGPLSMSSESAVDQKGLVTVYHKETCPYCKKAMALLEGEYSLTVSRVDVLEGDDSDKKIKQMKTFSGRNTVPQIFFNSEHIGGNDDLQKLHEDGKLKEMTDKLRTEAPGMMKDSWYHPWY